MSTQNQDHCLTTVISLDLVHIQDDDNDGSISQQAKLKQTIKQAHLTSLECTIANTLAQLDTIKVHLGHMNASNALANIHCKVNLVTFPEKSCIHHSPSGI